MGHPENSTSNSIRKYFIFAFLFSISVNLLFLVSPIYMLQIYDRVLTSGSQSTLVTLSVIACFLLIVFAFAEGGRRRSVIRAGAIFTTYWETQISEDGLSAQGQSLNRSTSHSELMKINNFLQNGGVLALFDLPFSPLFMLALFLLHPLIGIIGIGGTIVLILFALAGERSSKTRFIEDQKAEQEVQRDLAAILDKASIVIALGMRNRVLARWQSRRHEVSHNKNTTLTINGFFSGGSKSLRQILQALVLGAGAFMVLKQEMSPGAMIAGSIIVGRALAPIDQIIGNWRNVTLVREAWKKLSEIEETIADPAPVETIAMPAPTGMLSLERIAVTRPGTDDILISPFSYNFEPGQVYALLGASGAGKTTLLNTIAGILATRTGEVTFGGRNIHQWPETDRGRFIGYLPQTIDLLSGTVGENISRFSLTPDEALHECAEASGALPTIAQLPQAFSTQIISGINTLSAGQQQIIGIARAWFGTPPLIILDEPTSNLDPELAGKFLSAVASAREKNAIIIIATHDPRLILQVDTVLSIDDRQLTARSKADYIGAIKANNNTRQEVSA